MELRLPIDETETTTTLLYVVSTDFVAIKERMRDKKKQYVFVFNVKWSDGTATVIWRSYSEFFDLQCRLLDAFPEEAGNRKKSRIIPYLPGRKVFKKSDHNLAEERKPHIIQYLKEVLLLPKNISQGPIAVSFFHKRKGDPVCFNQFPSELNTRSEFTSALTQNREEENGPDRMEVNDSQFPKDFNFNPIGQENLSYERSLSIGNRSHVTS